METLAKIYQKQVDAGRFADRGTVHSYIDYYETLFAPYRETAKRVLEIGVYDGGGLLMLEQYFAKAQVTGIDCSDRPLDKVDLRPFMAEMIWKKCGEREYLHAAHDVRLFDATNDWIVALVFGDEQFDMIIDDAAHTLDQQLRLLDIWRPRLAPGGLMITEDIQDLDRDRHHFESYGCETIDRRSVKGRYDDVLAIWRKP